MKQSALWQERKRTSELWTRVNLGHYLDLHLTLSSNFLKRADVGKISSFNDKTQERAIIVSRTHTVDFYFWPRWSKRDQIFSPSSIRKPYEIYKTMVFQDTGHQATKSSDPWDRKQKRWAPWFTAQFTAPRVSRHRENKPRKRPAYPQIKETELGCNDIKAGRVHETECCRGDSLTAKGLQRSVYVCKEITKAEKGVTWKN